MNLFISLCCVLTCLLWVGLFHLKYRVVALESELATLSIRKKTLQDRVHVLQAEWAYLNRLDRLEKLAQHHLKMIPSLQGQTLNEKSLKHYLNRGDKKRT